MFFPVEEWFPAFLLTLAVEIPVAVFLLRHADAALPRLVLLVVFANLATHPAVWFVFTQLFLVGTPEYVLAAEGWAFGAEALFYAVAVNVALKIVFALFTSLSQIGLALATSVGAWVNLVLLYRFAKRADLISFDPQLRSTAVKLSLAGAALAVALLVGEWWLR